MIPTFFTRVVLQNLDMPTVAEMYGMWAIGLGPFGKLRQRRRDIGVGHWDLDDLLNGSSFKGSADCHLASRRTNSEFLMHFSHRDGADPAVIWHTVATVEATESGTVLCHGGSRSAPHLRTSLAVPYPPGIVSRILKRNGAQLRPADLGDSSLMPLAEDDVDQFVAYVLTDSARDLPFVVVSRCKSDQSVVVTPKALATALTSMARVVVLPEGDGTRIFNQALTTRGFSRLHTVGDGAVRIYQPGLAALKSPYDHRLWIRPKIEEQDESDRTLWVAGGACREILRRTLPRGFFDALAQHDIKERRFMAEALLALEAGRVADSQAAATTIPALEERIRELTCALQTALDSSKMSEREWLAAETAREQGEATIEEQAQRIDDLEDQLRRERLVRKHLTETTSASDAAAPVSGIDDDCRRALAAAFDGTSTLEQTLVAAQILYPDSLVVLDTALRSARDSEAFKYRERARDLVFTLAGAYRSALLSGQPDGTAGKVFGKKAFAARESETVMNSDRATRLRTFRYDGKDIVMQRHLKIGVNPGVTETLRVHFEWYPKHQRIVIGHCGKHLDHK
ncbi:MAG: hypothetical protein AB7I45_01290 [Planctomycetota bacterium]